MEARDKGEGQRSAGPAFIGPMGTGPVTLQIPFWVAPKIDAGGGGGGMLVVFSAVVDYVLPSPNL